jgi:hypothetical protein
LFSPSDVGSYKAEVLVNRLNLYYGLDWRAYASKLERDTINEDDGGPEFLIGCVDSAAARRELAQCPFHYWLDLGNQEKKGQVILGNQFESSYRRRANDAVEQLDGDLQDEQPVTDKLAPEVRRQRKTLLETEFKRVMADRLPNVMEIFPELMDTKRKEDDAPSCSLAEALGRQDLFINQSIATFALQLLWQFIRQGGTNIQGYFINLETGQTRPLPVGAPFTKPDTKLGRAVKRCVKGWTATAKKKRTTKRK